MLNDHVKIYKQQLKQGSIQIAYAQLIKYMMELDTTLSKTLKSEFTFGSIFQGYMDFTYFYYTNDFLKSRKLKLGLVLNHPEMRFEIWLLGQTKPVQEEYWQLLKDTSWCEGIATKPKYAVFEKVIVNDPDFNDLKSLTTLLERELLRVSNMIIEDLKKMD